MMYADIVPFVRLPRSQSTFTYAIPEALMVHEGSIVEIMFRKKRTYGCVLRVHGSAPTTFEPKPITALLRTLQLSKSYCELLNHIAVITCTSPSIIYRDVVPLPPKRIKVPEKTAFPTQQSLLMRKTSGTALLMQARSTGALHRSIMEEILAAQKQHARLLVLFPTHERMQQCIDIIPRQQKKQITIFHAQLGKRAYWEAWQRIADGYAIVFGTRSAIFAPGMWDRIIHAYEEDAAYKQEDQNPRYRAHDIAEYQRQHYGTDLLFITHAPRVTTWHHVSHQKIDSVPLTIRLLDMRGSRHTDGLLHDESIRAMRRALDADQQVTLVVARSGYAGSMLCKDCGFVLTCPNCKRPLRPQEHKLFCSLCNTWCALPSACSKCHGAFFDFQGIGAERLKETARKVFSDTKHELITMTTTSKNIPTKTQLVIIVSSEALLHRPDFRASEQTYQWLAEIASTVNDHHAALIVQSWTPEHPIFSALVQGKPELFYAHELKERQSAHYPPFVRSALAIWKSPILHGRALATSPQLPNTIIAQAEKAGIILSEHYLRRDPTKGIIQNVIYIRQPADRDGREFTNFLQSIPEPWIIDREPENIF